MYVPDEGYHDLGAVGWLNKLESFQCFFAYQPSKIRINHTSESRPVPKVANSLTWPFVAMPQSENDISEPALSNASSTNHTGTDRNITTPPSGYGANDTTSIDRLNTRSSDVSAGCYICSETYWTGLCSWVRPQFQQCWSMLNWHAKSFGPDQGLTCRIFESVPRRDFEIAGLEQLTMWCT